MKRAIPDGSKIALLRKKRGEKQAAIAKIARISERQMRKIEKENISIPEDILVEIAKFLEVSPDELKISSKKEQSDPSGSKITRTESGWKMKLAPVESGGALFRMAWFVSDLNYSFNVDPDNSNAQLFEDLLSIIQCRVDPFNMEDGFEHRKFPDIHRIARLNDISQSLHEMKIKIFANYYFRTTYEKDGNGDYIKKTDSILHIAFDRSDVEEVVVGIRPDHKPPPDYDPSRELDDDIPF